MRIGHGFDVHRFGGEGPITLAGVKIPYQYGLIAHSDGDVVLHAITDALIGALALGDIGKFFPDNDPQYLGIDSRILLKKVYSTIQAKGYQLVNLDTTIIAQEPKMRPHIDQMRINIAEDLNVHFDQISVKATTTEQLGFTGRKEGIACEAVVLLTKIVKDN
ncbi:2-C-methyl-D-erythritol 2,4-cyclodiphosphate synthase [Gilliamella sp. wkB171]|uniref:2-C-methyl-D-erythritol 2,4-cyclodiphosphate synthase n=1 Tax=Gilliamella sp. wkB171 TaxID=3120258 RepID=UPI00081349C7|nr:2-C-methyl-D-erythritol 2,4-cyclodiphosphate synthase [Gilliamella apicola]OCL19204.1 2-C-methyl-D-erythritol 2,4-cyclodiphosphate synthase [Gilliamella apicola]